MTVKYAVRLPAHSEMRETVTLAEALKLARASARDGWGATRIVRLADGTTLYHCEITEEGDYTRLRRKEDV